MITTIRARFKHSTYRYVVFFMIFAIILGMASSMLMKTDRSAVSWAVKVNGAEISYQDFAREVAEKAEFLNKIRAQYGQYADLLFHSMGWVADPKALALDMLIKEELLSQYADTIGIVLHSDYIANCVSDQVCARQNLGNLVPAFAFDQSGALDMNILHSYVRRAGMSMKDFEYKIERALKINQLMSFVGSTAYLPLFDIKDEFIAKELGKKFSFLTFSLDHFLAAQKKNPLTEQELQTFYDAQNKQLRRYWVPEKRNGIMWRVDPGRYGLAVSEQEIAEYYEDNKVKLYVAHPIKIEVRQITEKQLAAFPNLSLDDVRQELLTNPASLWNNKWELVAPFARGEKKGEFEKTAFLLQNEGDISSVIDTADGKVLLQLVKRIPRTYKPLSAVKNDIKDMLINKKFKKSFVKDIKTIASQGDSAAIEAFIAQKAGKKEIVFNVMKDDDRLAQELFSLKKGEYGFYIDGEIGVAVVLTDIQERNLPALESIKDVVATDLYEEQAREAMHAQVVKAQEQAANTSFEELHNLFKVPFEHTEMMRPFEAKKMQAAEKRGLPIRDMMMFEKVGSIFVHNGDRDSFLIKLDALETWDENKFAAMQKDIIDHVGPMRIKLYLESFVASLHRNATIETNELILIADEEYSE
jgi:SurA-like protein/parvulin-like peptidyl-prolyl cis-trans isomerase-like protein